MKGGQHREVRNPFVYGRSSHFNRRLKKIAPQLKRAYRCNIHRNVVPLQLRYGHITYFYSYILGGCGHSPTPFYPAAIPVVAFRSGGFFRHNKPYNPAHTHATCPCAPRQKAVTLPKNKYENETLSKIHRALHSPAKPRR